MRLDFGDGRQVFRASCARLACRITLRCVHPCHECPFERVGSRFVRHQSHDCRSAKARDEISAGYRTFEYMTHRILPPSRAMSAGLCRQITSRWIVAPGPGRVKVRLTSWLYSCKATTGPPVAAFA